jgi:hypothetical protein
MLRDLIMLKLWLLEVWDWLNPINKIKFYIAYTKWYNKPKWLQKFWFKYIIKEDEFHWSLEIDDYRQGEITGEMMDTIVLNRSLAHQLDSEGE